MIKTLKHFPKAFGRELKQQFSMPVFKAVKLALQGELHPDNVQANISDLFKRGFMRGLLDQAEAGNQKATPPDDKERRRAYALGVVAGSAIRSLGSLGAFWVTLNGVLIGVSGLVGGIGLAVQAVQKGEGVLGVAKGLGIGGLAASLYHANWGNWTAAWAGAGGALQTADAGYEAASGAVNGSRKAMIDGKYGIAQGVSTFLAATTGFPFLPVLANMIFSSVKAWKIAKAEADEEIGANKPQSAPPEAGKPETHDHHKAA